MFVSASKQPPHVEGDDIIPLEPQNGHWMMRSQLWNHLFRYDDVLDPRVLHEALEQLQERGHWRILGARLRKDAQGNACYHVPRQYTAERPGIGFTTEHHASSIHDHPEGRHLPQASARPATFAACDFAALRFSPAAPRTYADFYYADIPQLHVHVVVFADATTVSVQYLHSLMDVTGCRDFLHAWSALVNGRPERVRDVVTYDPLAAFGAAANPRDYLLYRSIITGWALVSGVFAFAWSSFKYKTEAETRNICLPRRYVERWRAEALDDLAGSGAPFVSDGDVIAAWLLQTALKQDDATMARPTVTLVQPISLRALLAPDLLPADKAYLGNTLGGLVTSMARADVLTRPLGWTAARLRRAVREQGSRAQQEALYRFDSHWKLRGVKLPLSIGDPASTFFGVTNWLKADMFRVDLRGAVVGGGADAARRIPRGLPTLVTSARINDASINGGIITGQDVAGDYWVLGAFRRPTWLAIERHLAATAAAVGPEAKL